MFDFFDNTPQLLPVKVKKEEAKLVPLISDPTLLAKKRQELQGLVKKATEDGEITSTEYKELLELTTQVGVNNSELNEMIKIEYKKALTARVQLFAEDGKIDEDEMKLLLRRAKEIGMSKEELNTSINEALSKYNIEMKKKIRKVCIAVATVAVGTAAAVIGLNFQKNKTMLTMAQKGNLKVSLSSITRNTNISTTHTKNSNIRHISEKKTSPSNDY